MLQLFRNRPELAPELLREAAGVALPAYREARIDSSDLGQVKPVEYRADAVINLVDGTPVLGIVLNLLTLRFGPLTEEVRGRIERLSVADLDVVAERLLSARSLEEALNTHWRA